jgi:hypothetical protein
MAHSSVVVAGSAAVLFVFGIFDIDFTQMTPPHTGGSNHTLLADRTFKLVH